MLTTQGDLPAGIESSVLSALAQACRTLPQPAKTYPREASVEETLAIALATQLPDSSITRQTKTHVREWRPQPYGFDLTVSHSGAIAALFELKVDKLDETLWDLLKLVAADAPDDAPRLIVVGASRQRFNGDMEGAGLFGQVRSAQTFYVREMLERWQVAWANLLCGGSARPQVVPAAVEVESIFQDDIPTVPGYELRALRVRMIPAEGTLRCVEGWPAGLRSDAWAPTAPVVETVRRICDELDREPLFHMSLGSKELFHSNFLAWFANTFPAQATAAFAPWTDPADEAIGARTKRESANLDLVLTLPGLAPLVIENKVFSVPKAEQLARYEAVAPTGAALVLLSLMPHDLEPNGRWQYRSYAELAKQLEAQLPDLPVGYARMTIGHYLNLAALLVDLTAIIGTPAPDQPLDLAPEVREPLQRIRIDAAFQKSRFAWIAGEIARRAREKWPGTQLILDHGLTRGMGLTSAYMPTGTGDHLGWQVQGNQFRLVVTVGEDNRGRNRAARERYVVDTYPTWFDFSYLASRSHAADQAPRPTRGSGYGSFEPDFCYKYVSCREITPVLLIDVGMHYLERAAAIRPRS